MAEINSWRCILFGISFTLISPLLFAQHDSLVFKNGDVIVGEIKSFDKGVLTIETDYSKSDFTIEWSGIKEIYSKSRFLITLKDGTRINGHFQSEDHGKRVIITDIDNQQTTTSLDNIVYMKGIKSNFWGRLNANIDLGLSLTKANNLRQYSMQSRVGYVADRWGLNLYYNDIRSKQDSVDATKRTESGLSFTQTLPKDWFLMAAITTLSNTEQALDLRFTARAGAGKYIVHTNKAYFGVGAGLSFNKESFTDDTPNRTSLEGFVGSKVNIFDLGDFDLSSDLFIYPSFTESGRWRVDFSFDSKYDLPHDLYIKFSLNLNYDNRPAAAGKETDYVMMFSVGWELE